MSSDTPQASQPPTRVEEHEGRTALCLQRFSLRILEGENVGRCVALEGDRIRVGTASSNDLVVQDPFASRLHAEVSVQPDGFRLLDLGSRNGTFLGPTRVVEAYVATGGRIRVGRTTLLFEMEDGAVRLPLASGARFGRLVGESPPMRRLFDLLERAARSEATVLLHGETGTGKEEAARSLHEASPTAEGPFVVVDCGAIPGTLLGSLLFGHERGAFTGADHARPGAFERAEGGTIFLDEIGELAEDLQPQFLRVLERREVQRIGSTTVRPVRVRVVAAANRDLRRDVNAGRFRPDLYFRLAVVEIAIPPLRDHADDIPLLVAHLSQEIAARAGVPVEPPSPEETERLKRHYWPGNVRELRNVLERRALFGTDFEPVEATTPPEDPRAAVLPYKEAKAVVVDRFERAYVVDLLSRAGGNVSKAAREAKMDRTRLIQLVKKHGLGKR